MTEVNGLRLAYRGFVGGLAAAYMWLAVAMILAALLHHDALLPLRPVALAVLPLARSPELTFVLGFAAVQAGGAFVGMCFAYFFARFFTRRSTLAAAAPAVAILAWALIAAGIGAMTGVEGFGVQVAPLVATIAYGLLLGIAVPFRAEVSRFPATRP